MHPDVRKNQRTTALFVTCELGFLEPTRLQLTQRSFLGMGPVQEIQRGEIRQTCYNTNSKATTHQLRGCDTFSTIQIDPFWVYP